jgi:hypothetical protein
LNERVLKEMAKSSADLTTKQFSEKAGIPVSRVTQLIRDGKIKARKQSGKWMIPKNQLSTVSIEPSTPPATKPKSSFPAKPRPPKAAATPASKPSTVKPAAGSGQPLNVSDFAAMTYLTEFGVTQWLKTGRLSGRQDENGTWLVDAANLEDPHIKRLLR